MNRETASTACQAEHLCALEALSLFTAQQAALPAQGPGGPARGLGAHLVHEDSWKSPESTLAWRPQRSNEEQVLSMPAPCS